MYIHMCIYKCTYIPAEGPNPKVQFKATSHLRIPSPFHTSSASHTEANDIRWTGTMRATYVAHANK